MMFVVFSSHPAPKCTRPFSIQFSATITRKDLRLGWVNIPSISRCKYMQVLMFTLHALHIYNAAGGHSVAGRDVGKSQPCL